VTMTQLSHESRWVDQPQSQDGNLEGKLAKVQLMVTWKAKERQGC
jgi:hypothetical protein